MRFDVHPYTNISEVKERFFCSHDMFSSTMYKANVIKNIEVFCGSAIVFCCIFFMARKIRRDVETSIHYVRIRELLAILEGAWVYDNKIREWNQPELFDDITKAGREFGERVCKKCAYYSECCSAAKGGTHE